MGRNVSDLIGLKVTCAEGDVGRVVDLYFDDAGWSVRHLVVEAGSVFAGRTIIVPIVALEPTPPGAKGIHTPLTRAQIEEGNPETSDLLVTRAGLLWDGAGQTPASQRLAAAPEPDDAELPEATDEPMPIGYRDVKQCVLRTLDGQELAVDDVVLELADWRATHLVVDTSWLPGGQTLLAMHEITGFDWAEAEIAADLTKEALRIRAQRSGTKPTSGTIGAPL